MAKKEVPSSFTNSLFFKVGLLVLGGLIVYLANGVNFNNLKDSFNFKQQTSSSNVTQAPCDEANVIDKTKKSVVRVIAKNGEGTGFLVDKEGYVVTNYHVIHNDDSPRVVFADQTPAAGRVFNFNEQLDLAIIQIGKVERDPLIFGDSDKLSQGQELIGIGFPLGQNLAGDATVTKGSFSAKRQSDIAGLEYIQVDANLNSGNSGSPIIDKCGEVMGILRSSISGTEGLKLAISAKTAKSMVESLISTGQKSLLSPTQTTVDQTTALSIVIQYYNYISTGQLESAYNLLSRRLKTVIGGKDSFLKGYNSTLNVYLISQRIDDPSINSIYVKFGAADLVNDKVLYRVFEGTWLLIAEDEGWRLDSSTLRQIQ